MIDSPGGQFAHASLAQIARRASMTQESRLRRRANQMQIFARPAA
jgi:hypothetical protein